MVGGVAAADVVFGRDLDDEATGGRGMEVNVVVEGDFGSVRFGKARERPRLQSGDDGPDRRQS